MNDTITAIATPIGEGGISVLRISGEKALDIAGKLFRPFFGKNIAEISPLQVYLGEIFDPENGQCVDEALLTWFKAPKSYTGEHIVEISAHGGSHVSARILQLILSQGARLAQPGEFTRRAFTNGRLDLTQAEAVADIIHASSDKALESALGQLKGRLSEKINSLYDRLLSILAQLEAAIDFPEEGLSFPEREKTIAAVKEIDKDLLKLIDSFKQGKIFREGAKAALVGKPNVGKSSLLNALLGEDRAIVTEHPGTTRDVLEERLKVRDIHINILDTAGLRNHPETIEKEGIKRTRSAIAEADIVLIIFDGSRPLDENDDLLIEAVLKKPCLVIVNKNDLPAKLDMERLQNQFPPCNPIHMSAITLMGMEALLDAIHGRVMDGTRSGEDLVITRERHRNLLVQASESLERMRESFANNLSEDIAAIDIQSAMDSIGEITGKNFADDLLDKIFGEFCIGK